MDAGAGRRKTRGERASAIGARVWPRSFAISFRPRTRANVSSARIDMLNVGRAAVAVRRACRRDICP